jgi:hypothetical protein
MYLKILRLLKFNDRQDGQSMAEFCIAVPLLVLLLWSIWYLTDMYIIKHKTLIAARYGTWLLSRYNNLPGNTVTYEQVKKWIAKNFFSDPEKLEVVEQHMGSDENRKFNDQLQENMDTGNWVDKVSGFLADHIVDADTPTIYSLKVRYEFPRIFGAVDLSEYSNENFLIESEHFVGGNSWDGARVDVHDLIGIFEEIVGDIVKDLKKAAETIKEKLDL